MLRTVTNSRNIASVFVASMVCFGVLLMLSVILITLSPQVQAQSSSGSSSINRINILVHSNDHSNFPTYSVFSADSKPYNLTYGEWTAKWWQWGYSIPKNINPAYDNTGKNCAQKQNGPVWFLAGTFGHSVTVHVLFLQEKPSYSLY
jgi:hypothetical protein